MQQSAVHKKVSNVNPWLIFGLTNFVLQIFWKYELNHQNKVDWQNTDEKLNGKNNIDAQI